jgi:bisphosphoglycerate-independent phosphoglycerate mutase (AlkP superfamily)
MSRRSPLVLAILDGWGYNARQLRQRDRRCRLPNWRRFLATYPHALLQASGEAVGLPAGVMGNSEVGHINIGSGRVVPQGVVVIDEAIADGLRRATRADGVLRARAAHRRDACTSWAWSPTVKCTRRSITSKR